MFRVITIFRAHLLNGIDSREYLKLGRRHAVDIDPARDLRFPCPMILDQIVFIVRQRHVVLCHSILSGSLCIRMC